MSVSRLCGETPANIGSIHEHVATLPPFWELEDLLASGLDREAALAVMAARRAGPRLVGDRKPDDVAACGLLPPRTLDAAV